MHLAMVCAHSRVFRFDSFGLMCTLSPFTLSALQSELVASMHVIEMYLVLIVHTKRTQNPSDNEFNSNSNSDGVHRVNWDCRVLHIEVFCFVSFEMTFAHLFCIFVFVTMFLWHTLVKHLNLIKFDIYNVRMRAIVSKLFRSNFVLFAVAVTVVAHSFNSVGNDDNSQINNQQNHHYSTFVCKR